MLPAAGAAQGVRGQSKDALVSRTTHYCHLKLRKSGCAGYMATCINRDQAGKELAMLDRQVARLSGQLDAPRLPSQGEPHGRTHLLPANGYLPKARSAKSSIHFQS